MWLKYSQIHKLTEKIDWLKGIITVKHNPSQAPTQLALPLQAHTRVHAHTLAHLHMHACSPVISLGKEEASLPVVDAKQWLVLRAARSLGEPVPNLIKKLPGCGKVLLLVSSSQSPSDEWHPVQRVPEMQGLLQAPAIVHNGGDYWYKLPTEGAVHTVESKSELSSLLDLSFAHGYKSKQGRITHETECLTPWGVELVRCFQSIPSCSLWVQSLSFLLNCCAGLGSQGSARLHFRASLSSVVMHWFLV